MAYFYNNNNNNNNNNNDNYYNNDHKHMHNNDDGNSLDEPFLMKSSTNQSTTTTTRRTTTTKTITMANESNHTDCGSSNCSLIDSDSSTGDGFCVGRSREHLHALLTVPLKTNIPRQTVNARERGRTRSVNGAFNSLRTLIPTAPYNRKLSKIEILRLTTSYICHLEACVSTGNVDRPCSVHQQQLSHNPPRDARSAICTFCVAASSTTSKSCQQ